MSILSWLLTSRMGRAVAVVALIGAAVLWLRWDAVQDERRAREAEANKARIGHIEGAKERRDEIDSLDDSTLLDRLLGRVPERDDD